MRTPIKRNALSSMHVQMEIFSKGIIFSTIGYMFSIVKLGVAKVTRVQKFSAAYRSIYAFLSFHQRIFMYGGLQDQKSEPKVNCDMRKKFSM